MSRLFAGPRARNARSADDDDDDDDDGDPITITFVWMAALFS